MLVKNADDEHDVVEDVEEELVRKALSSCATHRSVRGRWKSHRHDSDLSGEAIHLFDERATEPLAFVFVVVLGVEEVATSVVWCSRAFG
jgi:hypothetical protein